MHEGSDSIIARAEAFFYFEDDLSNAIESWASTRCESFVKTEDNEHPLEHQQLFMEYQHMFEDVMSAFITNEGFTIQQFYQEVQQELEALPKGSDQNTTFASVLFSALDFTTFCEMMNDVKEGRGVVFCPPLISLESDFYGDQDDDDIEAFERLNDMSKGRMYSADSKFDELNNAMMDIGGYEEHNMRGFKGVDGKDVDWGEEIFSGNSSREDETKEYENKYDHKGFK